MCNARACMTPTMLKELCKKDPSFRYNLGDQGKTWKECWELWNRLSLRIPSYVKRNIITINPVRAHATRVMITRTISYPDLESSWRPRHWPKELEVSEYEIKPESTHNGAKVCYFTKRRRWMSKIRVTLYFSILSGSVRPQSWLQRSVIELNS